jgi:hypothetical protein
MFRRAVAALVIFAAASAAPADDVVLVDGDVLRGKVLEKSDVEVVLDHPLLGKVKIPAARVKEVRIGADAKPPEPPPPPPPPPRNWKAQFEAGVNGAEGNSNTINGIAGFKWEHAIPKKTASFTARYFYSETGKNVPGPDNNLETKESRLTATARRDWIFESNDDLSFFAEARYDRDINTPWDQRATAAAGLAWKFVHDKTKDHEMFLGLRIGAAATKEWGNEENPLTEVEERDLNRHVRPEGLLGLEAKIPLSSRSEFTAQSTWYPDLSDLWESRVLSSAGITYKLDEKGSMYIRTGVEHEWDTHREDPFKRQDVRYFALFVLDF